MRLQTYSLNNQQIYRRYGSTFLIAVIIYAALFGIAAIALNYKNHKTTGQLAADEVYPSGVFSDNLDLRVAKFNSYPSSAISVVKNLGKNDSVSQKIISFDVQADSLKEYGLMMQPNSAAPPQGYPVVILLHGYSNPKRYKTTAGYLNDMKFYAKRGFVVIKPDYRGQGLSINQGHPNSAYYSMAYNNDIMSLVSAIKQTSYLDKSRINLWGHSLGAYIALRVAVLSTDIQNIVLLAGPVDSLSKMYLSYIPPSDENNMNALKTRQEIFSKYGIPDENTKFWKNASPISFVGDVRAHIQIYVGSLDTIVPPEFSANLDEALSNSHIEHEYNLYKDGNHSLAAQRSQIWQRSLKAFQSVPPSRLPSD